MTHTLKLAVMAALVAAGALTVSAQTYEKTENGVKVNTAGADVAVDFYTPSTVRIVKVPQSAQWNKESLSVIAGPQSGIVKSVNEKNGKVYTKSDRLTVVTDLTDGTVSFERPDGEKLVAESGAARFEPVEYGSGATLKVGQGFGLDAGETIYGLGNLENGRLSQRGVNRKLLPGNVEDGIPYFHSIKNYSIFWDNYSPTEVSDKDNVLTFTSDDGAGVDYYFMAADDADGVVALMRDLTGQVPMMPLWAYGFMQSRERYKSQDETIGVVKKYRELGIPLDCIIQDWQYWGNNYLWNAMEFMNADFSRPQEMIDEAHRNNARMMISVWSSFGPQTKPFRELADGGMLFDIETWPQSGISEQWPPRMDYPSGVKVYDVYNPAARDIYWKYLSGINDMGMDGWWMDSTEPDHFNVTEKDFDTKTYLGSFRSVRGAFPLMAVGGVYDRQRAASPGKRVCILTRSGFAGQQRYGCNVWTGDVVSTWESMRNQIPAHLNFSLTGNPNVNSDLGGFFAGAYNGNWEGRPGTLNPAFRELYVRWSQMGVFTPMMRSHGTDIPREIYLYGKAGEPIYDALVGAVKLRYALMPYIYSTAWDVSRNSSTFMRALMMDFPDDSRVADCSDEYMFGDAFLVAPVLHAVYTHEDNVRVSAEDGWNRPGSDKKLSAGADVDFTGEGSMDVYLPAGTDWYDFHSGKRFEGGQDVTVTTAIDRIPVFVRAGSIVPVGPDVNYTTEKPWDNLEIRVYPGADGHFTLYEDDGETYGYEKGEYSEIDFDWSDKKQTLTVSKRNGEYPEMLRDRTFRIVKVSDGQPAAKTVSYNGRKLSVKL